MPRIIYLTHPQVTIDPALPVEKWGLSPLGRQRAQSAARAKWVKSIGAIFSSCERKAQETAAIFAAMSGVRVIEDEALGENDRSATGFIPPDKFEKAADVFFAEPDVSFRGWETARDAQTRIVGAVDRLLEKAPQGTILFCGHGAVGTLLKCAWTKRPISRSDDQPGGGGNLFAFDLEASRLLCDWTPMELFEGF